MTEVLHRVSLTVMITMAVVTEMAEIIIAVDLEIIIPIAVKEMKMVDSEITDLIVAKEIMKQYAAIIFLTARTGITMT